MEPLQKAKGVFILKGNPTGAEIQDFMRQLNGGTRSGYIVTLMDMKYVPIEDYKPKIRDRLIIWEGNENEVK